ncbi:MAG: magnesium/cobalt transporter CorA [Candidatus Omnitrophota bacterium]
MVKEIGSVSERSASTDVSMTTSGNAEEGKTEIAVIEYNEPKFLEIVSAGEEEYLKDRDASSVTWINVDGVHDFEIVKKIGEKFGLHPLLIEDIVNTSQRPRCEYFDEHVFATVKMIYSKEDGEIISEQVSILLNKNCVISFQERKGDVFDIVRGKIRTGKGRIRKMGADYLAYSLIDAVVDNYFKVLEDIGEKIEAIEETLITDPGPEILQSMHKLKRGMIFLRKAVWPLREVISSLSKMESKFFKKSTGIYLRDLYEHTIQVIDTVETYRDMISGMLDIYLSGLSNRMNEVMKFLTIFASIFIPLTFIAGVYGMNFHFMPELNWKWAYFFVLGLMAAVAGTLLIYFKRKNWL